MRVAIDDMLSNDLSVLKFVSGTNVDLSETCSGDGAIVTINVESDLQSEVTDHIADTTAAHAASAISASSTTLVGVGTDVQAVLEELDNGIADHLADTSAAHAASAVSVSSATLVGVGTDVQAVFEEIDDAVATNLASVTAINVELPATVHIRTASFVETAGAGTYTHTQSLPAGSRLVLVDWKTTAAWDADTAVLDPGVTGALTQFGNDINVDGTGQATILPVAGVASYDATGAANFVASIVTTGAGGTTGRTQVTYGYVVPVAGTAPVKT